MCIRLMAAMSAAVALVAASAAFSKDGLPQLDIQKYCRANQSTTDAVFGTNNANAFELCVKSEEGSRDKLMERWPTISALDKTSCIHPSVYSPSYFEWLGCIDTRVYVQKMRAERPASMGAGGRCPTVNWKSNGEISGIVACNLSR